MRNLYRMAIMGIIFQTDRTNTYVRRILLAAFVLLCYILQSNDSILPAIHNVHAIILVPVAVCIGMFEREISGMFFGLFAGALLDAFSTQVLCFSSVALTAIAFFSGALITHLMRNNLSCAYILTIIFTFLYNSLFFVIEHLINHTEAAMTLYLKIYLPSVVYTVLFTPFIYFIVRRIEKRLRDTDI